MALFIALVIVVADQALKAWILSVVNLPQIGTRPLFGPFALTMVWNQGVSFGFLRADHDIVRWLLAGFSIGVAVLLAVWVLFYLPGTALLPRDSNGITSVERTTVGLVLGMTGEAGEMTADVHRDIRPQRAGEHSDDGHPADVRVCRRLDHFGDQWPVLAAGQRLPFLARRGIHRRQDVLDR